MNKYKKYDSCVYCGSKKIKKEKNQFFPNNFYLDAIKIDLLISEKEFKRMKVYKCSKCFIIQNNPWFVDSISRKIYSNVYGQHNRSWSNLISFIKKGLHPNHGQLFEILENNIKIKNYAEFNSPFMGLFLNFFSKEYKENKNFYNLLAKNIIGYLTSRQVAGKSKKIQKLSIGKSKKFLKKIIYLKKKNLIKKKINKYLFTDHSSLCWGQNDNYRSVNSKSFATEIFDLEIIDTISENKKLKLDLFGIFHTLDHTFKPSKILNFALDTSKYVVVYCHVDPQLNKQHLFSLTKDFLKYLNKEKIYTLNITDKIYKEYKSPELYFLCSKNKKYMNKIKI
jgi:hypothetical protein